MTPVPAGTDRTMDALDGIRDALGDLHRGDGTPYGEPSPGCPGCEGQALVEQVRAEVARLTQERDTLRDALDSAYRYRESQEGLPPGTLKGPLAAVSSSPATTEEGAP